MQKILITSTYIAALLCVRNNVASFFAVLPSSTDNFYVTPQHKRLLCCVITIRLRFPYLLVWRLITLWPVRIV